MRRETERWLRQAQEDLITAEANLQIGRYYVCALFAQQTAEKALKGLYIEHLQHVPPRTHNLVLLAEQLDTPANLDEDFRLLNPAYVTSRYPDVMQDSIPAEAYDHERASLCLEAARRALAWVESKR